MTCFLLLLFNILFWHYVSPGIHLFSLMIFIPLCGFTVILSILLLVDVVDIYLAFPLPHSSDFFSFSFFSRYKQCSGEDPCRPHRRDADALQLKTAGGTPGMEMLGHKVWASSLFLDITNLHSHAQGIQIPVVLWSHQRSVFPDFKIFVHPKGMKCCLVFLTAGEVERTFSCFLFYELLVPVFRLFYLLILLICGGSL